MDYLIPAIINGQERFLNYSIEIMFKVNEKFGGVNKALDAVAADTPDGVDAVRWFAVELANDGELCRREAGYDPQPMLKLEELSMRMRPIEYASLKASVVKAIFAGYKKDLPQDENQEVDLGLAELNEKKAPAGA